MIGKSSESASGESGVILPELTLEACDTGGKLALIGLWKVMMYIFKYWSEHGGCSFAACALVGELQTESDT